MSSGDNWEITRGKGRLGHFSPDEIEAIRQRIGAGGSVRDVARDLKCSSRSVCRHSGAAPPPRAARARPVPDRRVREVSPASYSWTPVCYAEGCFAARAAGSKFCESHVPKLGVAAVRESGISAPSMSRLMAGR